MTTEDPAIVDPLMHGLRAKGLKKGSVSLVGAVAIGLAATAPAYSLTGALGHGADESGYRFAWGDLRDPVIEAVTGAGWTYKPKKV